MVGVSRRVQVSPQGRNLPRAHLQHGRQTRPGSVTVLTAAMARGVVGTTGQARRAAGAPSFDMRIKEGTWRSSTWPW
jgi:hypothetical protein